MRIIVLTTQVPFIRGGAEIHADNLLAALRAAGHEADLCTLPFKWYPAPAILDHMLAARLYDLSEVCGVAVDRVIALKFPAYLVPHHHKVGWLLHQHRSAYELWGTSFGDLEHHADGETVRAAIHAADARAIGEMRTVFANSETVKERLRHYNGIESKALYHPPHPPEGAEQFYCLPARDYLFYPSRLEKLKRQELVLEALARCRNPVAMVFCGLASDPAYAIELADMGRRLGLGDRVRWLGHVGQEEKLRLYAESVGVVFPPLQEDLGYVTMEAMLAAKPVITCRDSGGPLEFVRPGETGLVADATPQALASAFDELWENRDRAAAWGRAGRASYAALGISWGNVVRQLTA